MAPSPHTNLATNRKARHDYEILDVVEAGIVLFGSEVKSLRAGQVQLVDAYARVIDNEVWLDGVHIPRP
jgi:SsrA-binding protein